MILMYHKVYPESPTMWWVTVDDFWRQMEELRRFKVVYLDEYDPSAPDQAVITFDGVYDNVFIYALPVLKEFGYPFELFIVGDTVGKDNTFDQPAEPPANFCSETQLKELVKAGGRLQWHSRSHIDLTLPENSGMMENELTIHKRIKKLDPQGFTWFAYPHGRHNDELTAKTKKFYSGALSCVAGNDSDRYKLNRVTAINKTTLRKSTVSLIIANYNYAGYLPEAVESVLRQTVQPEEILLIDDCSIDNSMEVAERYKDKIRIVRNEKNLGIVNNFNKAISLTTGDYICFLGADNRFRSDYVEKCRACLDANPDAAVAYTDALLFGPRAGVLAQKVGALPVDNVKDTYVWQFPDFNTETKKTLEERNFIHGSSMYRRSVFNEVGGYMKSGGPEDHNLFTRMINKGWNAVRVPEYLLEYRQHSSGQANTQMNYALELAYYRKQFRLAEEQNRTLRKKVSELQQQMKSIAQKYGAGRGVLKNDDLNRVHEYIAEKKYDEALQECALLFSRFTEQAQVFYCFSHALAGKGELKGAESAMKYAVFCNPDFALAYNDLGVIFYQTGDKDRALVYYEKAAALEPENTVFQKNLADFYCIELNRFDDAMKIYLKLMEQNPGDVETLLSIGYICMALKHFREAISFYRKALELDPANTFASEKISLLTPLAENADSVTDIMKSDWNNRALEDAAYYVHSTHRRQPEEEFDSSGRESVRLFIEDDLERISGGKNPKDMEALEIGCGIGRMTKHMAAVFGKVYAIDVSGEMIARAKERLSGTGNVFLYETNGKDLSVFPDNKFDFVFSFIVFQHIPSKEVIMNYIKEAHRVLKPDGVFKFQVQGCTDPEWLKQKKDTWHGVTITFNDIRETAGTLGFEIKEHNGDGTQYSWYILVKKETPASKFHNDKEGIDIDKRQFTAGLTSIVIPVFNKVEYTSRCIDAVKKNTPEGRYELIIVDNASTDGTGEVIPHFGKKGGISNLKIITNTVNLGFTLACNQGARAASGEYVLFLNNDTEPQAGWLESLLALMESDSSTGIAGSKLVYPDGRLQEAGGIIFSDGSGWNYGRFDNPKKPLYNYTREVDYVSGASLIIRRSLLKKLNYFDEQYSPGYYEDTDLCFGARALGYNVMYCPFSVVVHHEGASSGTDLRQGMKKHQVINRDKFVRKWEDSLKKQYMPDRTNVIPASERGIKGNILIIDPFMPKFDRASGSLRLFTIIKILREQNYHITYIARNGQGQQRYERILNWMGVEVYSTDAKRLREIGIQSEAGDIDLEEILRIRHYNIALLSFYEIALQYLDIVKKASPETKILVDTVDIHFVREMRMAEISGDRKLSKKAKKTKENELSVYSRADAVVTVTEKDWEHISNYLLGMKHYVIPNIHEVTDTVVGTQKRKGLLFVGNFNHPPNADAVKYFIDDIFPLIRKTMPDIVFTVVGNNPPEEILKLHCESINIAGYVSSTEPYLESARVSVAPLRYGAGMKGKIGEAMAHGLPVVTTSVGAEGMGLTEGRTALIADTPEAFAEKVIYFCENDSVWHEISEAGREFIRKNYSKETVGEKISEIVESLIDNKTDHKSLSNDREIKKGLTSIIVLTFNGLRNTKECVESIRNHTPNPYEIIFVDNGSTDGTVKWLRQLAGNNQNYKIIENKSNLGFAKGCNQGIKMASGEYILLLNNDVVVTESWLSGMLECLNSSESAGIVGPMTNNISGIQKVAGTEDMAVDALSGYAKTFRETNRHRRIPARRIAGFCTLFRQDLVREIGVLDEAFGSGNFEDDDICLRASLAGYRNMIAGDVFIHHYGNRSFINNRIDYRAAMANNQKIFTEKWSGLDRNSEPGIKLSLLKTLERADNLRQLGKVEDSVREYLGAIRLNPDDARIYNAFAEMLIGEQRFQDAFEVLNQSPARDSDKDSMLLKAQCLEGLEKIHEAEKIIDEILSHDSTNAPALNLKGQIAYKKGSAGEAERLFLMSAEADPSYGVPVTNLGVLKWSDGKVEEALDLAEKGFMLLPYKNDVAAIYHSIAAASGKYERCEKTLIGSKGLYPNNRRTAFLLIDVLIKQGKNLKALEYIQEAMITFGKDDGMIDAALEIRNRMEETNGKQTTGNREKAGVSAKTLSLCMIVKNEEETLPACLMSIKPVVDEIIIVDTGSTDRTKDLAKIFGAKVFDFQWTGDFSEARNYSLSKTTGDWILVLDADEVISAQDHPGLRELIKNAKVNTAYSVTTRNYVNTLNIAGWVRNGSIYSKEEKGKGWFPGEKVRLFPNRQGIEFRNRVHELVEASLEDLSILIKKCDIPVHHYGKLEEDHTKSKGENYYMLGIQKINENVSDPKAIYELAVQAGELDRHQEALDLWQKLLEITKPPVSDKVRLKAYINMGHAYLHLGQYQEAFEVSKKAFRLSPDSVDAIMNYSLAEIWTGEPAKAIPEIKRLLEKSPDMPQAIGLLGIAYLMTGDKEQGWTYLERITKKGYNCANFIYNHTQKMLAAGRTEYANRLINMAVDKGVVNEKILKFQEGNMVLRG